MTAQRGPLGHDATIGILGGGQLGRMLALNDAALAARLAAWRKAQTDAVAERPTSSGERA